MEDFVIKKLDDFELKGLYSYMKPIWLETYSFLPVQQVELLLHKYFDYDKVLEFVKNGYEYYALNKDGVLVVQEQEVGLYVDKLYVLPSARGKNYPKRAFDFLSKRGKELYLNVNINNKRAVACYLKNGFKIEKKIDIDLGNGFINSDYIMRKEIGMDLIIRKATILDLDALNDFYNQVLDHLVKTINYPRWTPGVYPCEDSIREVILKGEQFVAIKDEKIVGAFVFNDDGAGDYSVGEWSRPLKDGEFGVVHTLATHPAAYGQGIARKMVTFCIDHAKVCGYKGLRLDVVPTNTPAIKLYSSLGFKFAGEKDLKRGFEHIPTFCLYEYDFE